MLRYSTIICMLLIALFAASHIITQKISNESKNKAIEMTMDFTDIINLSSTNNLSAKETIEKLQKAGINAISLEMDTIQTAIEKGRITQNKTGTYIINGYDNPKLIEQIFKNTLNDKAEIDIYSYEIKITYDPSKVNKKLIESLPIGFYTKDLEIIRSTGLNICARIPDFEGATKESIKTILNYIKENNINQIIFAGDTILGYKKLLKYTGAEMVKRNIYFGKIEFSKQKGENIIALVNEKYLLPTHSITQAEMQNLSDSTIIERFTRAVRERGIKLLYIRSITKNDTSLEDNLNYIKKLKYSIEKAGYTIKNIHPREIMPDFKTLKVLTSLGISALLICLFSTIFKLSNKAEILTGIIITLFFVLFAYTGGIFLKISTFTLAIITPTLGAIIALKNPYSETIKRGNIWTAILSFFIAVGITLYGGIINTALLSTDSHMLRNEVFLGVKLAHFLPILILAILLGFGLIWNKLSPQETIKNIKKIFIDMFEKPVLIGYTLIGAVIFVIVGLMLARSGNDTGIGISAIELKFRAILDQIVYIRPRTKELIGYPVLLLGLYYAFQNKKTIASILVTLGSIGLISMFNTFCHIHTPTLLSLARAGNGIWCGLLIGLISYFIISKLMSQKEEIDEKKD